VERLNGLLVSSYLVNGEYNLLVIIISLLEKLSRHSKIKWRATARFLFFSKNRLSVAYIFRVTVKFFRQFGFRDIACNKVRDMHGLNKVAVS
jgi:hypothetical protein